jgi:outer membrane lipoprotein-sorting protein
MIKKIVTFVLVLSMILLVVGCQSQNGATTTQTSTGGQAGPEDVKVTQQQISNEQPTPAAEPEVQMSSDVVNVLNKAESVTSVKYSLSKYVPGGDNDFADVVVKGDKMKYVITLMSGTYGERYSTAYVDLSTNTAVGYCEDIERCEDPNKAVSVDLNKLFIETPFDVLNSLKTAVKESSEMFDSKEAMIVKDDLNGNTRRVWIWTYKGIPVKYELTNKDDAKVRTVEFKSLVVNGVKDSELVHQYIKPRY